MKKAVRKVAAADQSTCSVKTVTTASSEKESAEVRQILKLVRDATGVSDAKEVVKKMERYSTTVSQLQEMQKSLQVKLLGLFSKRDDLQKQLEGTQSEGDKEQYDKLDQEVTLMDTRLGELKSTAAEARKLRAEVASGIQMLCGKLGVPETGDIITEAHSCMQRTLEIKQLAAS